jgi:hypothetical protein
MSWSRNVAALFHQASSSDVIIRIREQKICCHRAILACQSHVFHDVFFGKQRDSNAETGCESADETDETAHAPVVNRKTVVDMTGSVEAVLAFLEYFYTGQVSQEVNLLPEIYQHAIQYQVHNLRTLCEDAMTKNLTLPVAVRLLSYALAVQREGKRLQATEDEEADPEDSMQEIFQHSIALIQNKFGDLVANGKLWNSLSEAVLCNILSFDDLHASEDEVLQAALSWLGAQDNKRSLETNNRILGLVRLPCLSSPKLLRLAQDPLFDSTPNFRTRYLQAIEWQLWLQSASSHDAALGQLKKLLSADTTRAYYFRSRGLPAILQDRHWSPTLRAGIAT